MNNLEKLREKINAIDDEISILLEKRLRSKKPKYSPQFLLEVLLNCLIHNQIVGKERVCFHSLFLMVFLEKKFLIYKNIGLESI